MNRLIQLFSKTNKMFLNLPVLVSKGEEVGEDGQKEKKTVAGSNHQSVTEVLFCPQGSFRNKED